MPSLEDVLIDIDEKLSAMGFDMDEETLQETARRLNHPEVVKAFNSGQMTTDHIISEVMSALRVRGKTGFAAEGGFINDRSGDQTRGIRNQLRLGQGAP